MALIAFRFDSPTRDSPGDVAAAAPAVPAGPRYSRLPTRLRMERSGRRMRGATLDHGFLFHPGKVFFMACPCSWSRWGERLWHLLNFIPGESQLGDRQHSHHPPRMPLQPCYEAPRPCATVTPPG